MSSLLSTNRMDDDCYEFVKYFVLGAKQKFEELTRPTKYAEGAQDVQKLLPKNNTDITAPNILVAACKIFLFVYQEVDKSLQETRRLNAETLLDSTSPSVTSKQRDEIFTRIFIRPALEIYIRCQNQLLFIRRKRKSCGICISPPIEASRKKAVEILAFFIGAECFDLMQSKNQTTELEQILFNLQGPMTLTNFKIRVWALINRFRQDQLCFNLGSGEIFSISKYKFFQRLLPAFSFPPGTQPTDQQSQLDHQNDEKTVFYLRSADHSKFFEKPWKSRPIYLRPPINCEFAARQNKNKNPPEYETLTIEKSVFEMFFPHGNVFDRKEGDDVTENDIDELYKKLMGDPTFDHKMAEWHRSGEISDRLTKLEAGQEETNKQLKELPEKVANLVISKQVYESQRLDMATTLIYPTKCPVDDPSPLFVGRDDLVQKIREVFDTFESTPRVERNHLQNIAVISGLGGMGKSEVCRQFAKSSFDQYGTKCFWIEAESFEKTRACILGLAMNFQIAPFNQSQSLGENCKMAAAIRAPQQVGKVAQSIYDHLGNDKESKALFIFDNVDNITQDQNFVTSLLTPQSTRFKHQPDILITSQHCERSSWPTALGAIMNVPVFTLEETLSYCRKKFDLAQNNVTFDLEIRNLYDQILQGFPLATVLAFAYIKKTARDGPTVEGIQNYRKLFDNTKDWVTVEGDADLKVKYDKIMANVWDKTLDHLNAVCPAALDLLNKLAYTNFYDFQLVQGFVQLLGGETETENLGVVSQIDYLEDYFLISKKRSFVTRRLLFDSPPYPLRRTTNFSRGSKGDYYLKKIGLHDFVARVTVAKLNEKEAAPDVLLSVAKNLRDILKGHKTDLDLTSQILYMFVNLMQPKKSFVGRTCWIGENISAILSFALAQPLYVGLQFTTHHIFLVLTYLQFYLAFASQDPGAEETEKEKAAWELKIQRAEIELETIQVYLLFHTLVMASEKIGNIGPKGMKKKFVLKPIECLLPDLLPGQKPEDVVDEEIHEISCEDAIAWVWAAMTRKCDNPSWINNVIDIGIQFLSWCNFLDVFANELDEPSLSWIKSYDVKQDWHLLLHFWIRSCRNSQEQGTKKRLGELIALFLQRLKDQLGKRTTPLPYGLLKIVENLCQDKVVGKVFKDKVIDAESHLCPEGLSILAGILGRCFLNDAEYTHEIPRAVGHAFGILTAVVFECEDGRKLLMVKNGQLLQLLQPFLVNWVESSHFLKLNQDSTVQILRRYFDFLVTLLSHLDQNFVARFWTQFCNSVKVAVASFKKVPQFQTANFLSAFYWLLFAVTKSASDSKSNLLGQILPLIREELCSLLEDAGFLNRRALSGYLQNFYSKELGQNEWWTIQLEAFMTETRTGNETTTLACQLASVILESLKVTDVEPPPKDEVNEDNSIYAEFLVPVFQLFEDTEFVEGVQVVYTNEKGERILRN